MDTVTMRQLEPSRLGVGCLGMSEHYGPTDWDGSIAAVRHALDLGVTLIDTADIYGLGHSEVLVGRALAGRRQEAVLCTKCGNDRLGSGIGHGRGDRDFLLRSCHGSLLRLGVETIDLYYLHRPPENVPIEDAVGTLAELVKAGKVREIGLSNVSAEEFARARAVHPIAAVQNQYSIWARESEQLAPLLAAEGIPLVAYSPLARGLLTGKWTVDALAPGDLRRKAVPAGSAGRRRADEITRRVAHLAAELAASPAQIALAWIYGRWAELGVPVIPVPGMERIALLEENIGALDLELSAEMIAGLDPGPADD